MVASWPHPVPVILGIGALVILAALGWLVAEAALEQQAASEFFPLEPPGLEPRDNASLDAELIRRSVGADGLLASHIDFFRRQVGRYPTRLEELVKASADPVARVRWRGPYLSNPRLLRDPWRQRYFYLSPGIHNPGSYDLWTAGPDGISGTHDDIGNW